MLKALFNRISSKDPRLDQLDKMVGEIHAYGKTLKDYEAGRAILEAPVPDQKEWVLAMIAWLDKRTPMSGNMRLWQQENAVRITMLSLLRRKLPFTVEEILVLLKWSAKKDYFGQGAAEVVRVVEDYLKDHAPAPNLKKAVTRLADTLDFTRSRDNQRLALRLRWAIDDTGVPVIPIQAGDIWSDTMLADMQALSPELQAAWSGLLATCLQASGSAPTAKWRKVVEPYLSEIDADMFKASLLKWFALVNESGADTVIDAVKTDLLKGLVWLCADREDAEMTRALTALAGSSYRRLPGIGPRAARVGNACVWALGNMPGTLGVAQLAVLKVSIKMNAVQKVIQNAMKAAARRLNLSPDDIEEMTVPTYGLLEIGLRRETVGEFTVELRIEDMDAALHWLGPDGKPRTSVPQAIKKQHGEVHKELTQTVRDIRKMLTAQRGRLDTLFLAQKKWEYTGWREHYLDHPLVGPLARRLIWKFSQGDRAASGIWWERAIVDRDGKVIDWLTPTTQVELWHPLSVDTAIVLAWREWLASHQVQQPFKQAHREIYLLTDAERTTRVYSNRFAAHILRQHQFNALCAGRGWKNQLRLLVDDMYPPATRVLPQWGLRAEFWVEGVGNAFGTDTNRTGTYLYIATDQVRFYALDTPTNYAYGDGGGYAPDWRRDGQTEPLELEQIPPLVLSEILRDVDLFVGVASVGNDPNWADGGPEGRYRDYWHDYSFGNLSETANTRRAVLEQLLPRLKIASKCQLTDRFLIVKGNLRTYKIHLGSGNILMEPNDQYLCIVPGRGTMQSAAGDNVFLPFEGDQTLAIVMSKAFLLAEDSKITDRTILQQIK